MKRHEKLRKLVLLTLMFMLFGMENKAEAVAVKFITTTQSANQINVISTLNGWFYCTKYQVEVQEENIKN